ncbi:MAG: DUF2793 domain-containing protein [Paracoccaceae bacterium]
MPDNSPILALPFIQPSQAQKHVTHNEALVRLDAIVQLVIEALDQTTPPVSPTEDKVYHIGAAPTGAWVGQAGKLAFFSGGAWEFVSPRAGWRAWVVATSDLQVFSGTAWLSTGVAQNNLPGVGIGTSYDATNKLAVSAAGSLFTHAGAGHRMALNKAGVTNTGSLTFRQTFPVARRLA